MRFNKKEIQPVSPVIPNCCYLHGEAEEVQVAKNQPEYRTLPSLPLDKNTFLTRWKIPFIQRLVLLFTGDLYLEIMHFRNPIQPLYLTTKPPKHMSEKVPHIKPTLKMGDA